MTASSSAGEIRASARVFQITHDHPLTVSATRRCGACEARHRMVYERTVFLVLWPFALGTSHLSPSWRRLALSGPRDGWWAS